MLAHNEYVNEHHFSRGLCARLENNGVFVTKVETGSTLQGVPDLFIQAKGGDLWIELKIMHKGYRPGECLEFPWRAGQQAWHMEYYRRHNKKKAVLTLMALPCGEFALHWLEQINVANDVNHLHYKVIRGLDNVVNYILDHIKD